MSVVSDIVRAYRVPRDVFAKRLSGALESRALVILMVACLMIFLAQLPSAQRGAVFQPEVPFDARMAAALFRSIFIAPLVFYTIAWISQLVARAFGNKVSGLAMRFALFWALLVASPLWLFWGLIQGFSGNGAQASIVGSVALLGFLVHWTMNLSVAIRA
ncbi:MAG: YIP1 family protein [Maritimibacter sp.]